MARETNTIKRLKSLTIILTTLILITSCSPQIDVRTSVGGNLLHTYSLYFKLPKGKEYLGSKIKGYIISFSSDFNITMVDDEKLADSVIEIKSISIDKNDERYICKVIFTTKEYTGNTYNDEVTILIKRNEKVDPEDLCIREFVKSLPTLYTFPPEVTYPWSFNQDNGDS
ncbi:MAG: hypothetical protein ACPLSJ_00580 [Thermosulfidibacteraceae bacterium]